MSLPIAVLASGRGSNLQAILDAIKAGTLDAQVVVVLSDKSNAKALERAAAEGIPAYHVDPKAFADKAAYEAALLAYIEQYHCELICLAGYMRILSPYFPGNSRRLSRRYRGHAFGADLGQRASGLSQGDPNVC